MSSSFQPRSFFQTPAPPESDRLPSAGQLVGLLRESAGRFAQQSGWKRHVPWLVGALGRTLALSSVFLYKNYPDSEGAQTAVRLNSWKDPLDPVKHTEFDARVLTYTDDLWAQLGTRLERNVPVVWQHATSPAAVSETLGRHGICCLLVVPVFAGTQWWGFLGGFSSSGFAEECSNGSLDPVVVELFSTVAVQMGNAIHRASVEQALRWSERLHRIQRDIALAGTRKQSGQESLTDLLAFICELGGFEAGAVETVQGAQTVRLAAHGNPPVRSAHEWYRDSFGTGLSHQPIYLGSGELGELARSSSGLQTFHSCAILPVVYQSRVSGVIQLFSGSRIAVPESIRRSLEAVTAEIAVLTTQVQTNEQVKVVNDRYRRAVTDGQIGVWELDLPTARVSVDPPVPQMFRLPEEQRSIRLSAVLAALSPGQRREVRELLRSPEPDAERLRLECRFTLPTGERRWYAVRARRHAGEGVPSRVTGTVIDITQERASQEELAEARRIADESSRAKSEFLARMSHELRTPLNAILGHTQLLHAAGGESGVRSVEVIERSAQHLMEMVDNILSQDSLEAGRLSIAPGAVSLERFLSTMEDEVSVLFRDSRVRFQTIRSTVLPDRIQTDPLRLRQVLHNLIGNAAKFTTAGSVALHVRWKGRRVRFSVTDTGSGIPPEDLNTIFVAFRRRQQPGSGTGLGLSISQELIRLMGSQIHVQSSVGRGSSFWFSLPVDSAAPADAGLPRAVEESELSGPAAVPRPSRLELDRLRELIQIGDIGGVRRYAADRATAGNPHVLFYQLVTLYAEGFRLRELRELAGEPHV